MSPATQTASSSASGIEQQSRDFGVSSRKMIAEGADVQVKEILLTPGEDIPWHHHSNVFDVFYCLEGTLTVQRIDIASQQPLPDLVLRQGETGKVEPGTAHRPINEARAGNCRMLVVQGVGKYNFMRYAPLASK